MTTRRATPPPDGNLTHGAISTYMAGCSCEPCRAVAARRRAEHRAAARTAEEKAMNDERRPIDTWSLEAACRNAPTDVWFPAVAFKRTGRPNTPIPPRAAAICDRCPVKPECLDYALRHNVDGIWGGTNEQGRFNLRRAAGITALPLVPADIRPPANTEERTAS